MDVQIVKTDGIVPASNEFHSDVQVKYQGLEKPVIMQYEVGEDYEPNTKFGIKVKPIQHFSEKNQGMIKDVIVSGLLKSGIERMNQVQYALYKVLLREYGLPADKADLLCLSPTGTGKTLAYLVPLLQCALRNQERKERKPIAIVICYGIRLLEETKRVVETIIDGTDIRVVTQLEREGLEHNEYDIGFFTYMGFKKAYPTIYHGLENLEFIILDEADQIMKDMRASKDVQQLKEYSKARIIQLTATGNGYMREIMNDNNMFIVTSGELNSFSPNIHHYFYEVNSFKASEITGFATRDIKIGQFADVCNPFDRLYQLITQVLQPPQKIVVFATRKDLVSILAHRLSLLGIKAAAYRSDYLFSDRQVLLDKFKDSTFDVLVGTRLVARGVDFDIDHVINYDLPVSFVEFIHRCGRAGRFENTGYAHTFVDFNNEAKCNPYTLQILLKSIRKMLGDGTTFFEDLPKSFQERIVSLTGNEVESATQKPEKRINCL